MPTQTVNSMSRTQCAADLFLLSESEMELIHSLLQDDLGFPAGNDLCVSALSTRQCFGETYPVFFCIYIYSIERGSLHCASPWSSMPLQLITVMLLIA